MSKSLALLEQALGGALVARGGGGVGAGGARAPPGAAWLAAPASLRLRRPLCVRARPRPCWLYARKNAAGCARRGTAHALKMQRKDCDRRGRAPGAGAAGGLVAHTWLTEAGAALLPAADAMLATAGEAAAALRDLRAAHAGRVALGASQTVGTYLMPRLLAAFRSRNPAIEVTLQVRFPAAAAVAAPRAPAGPRLALTTAPPHGCLPQVDQSRRVCDAVAAGAVDCAIIGGEVPAELAHSLRAEPFAQARAWGPPLALPAGAAWPPMARSYPASGSVWRQARRLCDHEYPLDFSALLRPTVASSARRAAPCVLLTVSHRRRESAEGGDAAKLQRATWRRQTG